MTESFVPYDEGRERLEKTMKILRGEIPVPDDLDKALLLQKISEQPKKIRNEPFHANLPKRIPRSDHPEDKLPPVTDEYLDDVEHRYPDTFKY